MKLRELEPTFLKVIDHCQSLMTDDIANADGIMFKCPKCFSEKKSLKGTHSIMCWQPNVADERHPKGGRWNLVGSCYDDLELQNGSSSILQSGCNAHFFIRNGEVIFC
jgi:hypothetical protein